MRSRDGVAGHHDHQPLDDVAQLADVTRPGIALQDGQGRGLERLDPAPVLARELRHEVVGQQTDVVRTVAQRGHEDRNDVQPEVEILAKAAAANFRLKVLVGRAQHAHVDFDPCRAAHRLHRLLLQDPQHLGLRLQAHVADLVEENRAAVGDLELAAAIGDRAR